MTRYEVKLYNVIFCHVFPQCPGGIFDPYVQCNELQNTDYIIDCTKMWKFFILTQAKHLNILENTKFPFWGENNMPGCFEINVYSQTSVFRNTCLKRNLHNQTTYLNYIQSQHVQFLKYLSEQSKTVAHLNDVRYSRDIHTMPFKNNYYKLDYYHLTVTSY